jgi:hypothetical protein
VLYAYCLFAKFDIKFHTSPRSFSLQESWCLGCRQPFPAAPLTHAECGGSKGKRKTRKIVARQDYTYQRHVDWMVAWIDRVDLTAFCDRDPITSGADRVLQRRIPGAVGQPHTIVTGAGHFIQRSAESNSPASLPRLPSRPPEEGWSWRAPGPRSSA